ncbi:protein of unknown function [Rhodovastum atsumiense]|nr:protein of unknown function [Rhodovastum atsumiense]
MARSGGHAKTDDGNNTKPEEDADGPARDDPGHGGSRGRGGAAAASVHESWQRNLGINSKNEPFQNRCKLRRNIYPTLSL